MKCRHCGEVIQITLVDLGSAPPSNAFLSEESLHAEEKWFPLKVLVCEQCWLVQTEDYNRASELFDSKYAYFSSVSSSWLDHAQEYVDLVVDRFHLNNQSQVVEVGANDGYLLQYVQKKNIPCIGIEPTASTAAAARQKGITIIDEFFGMETATQLVKNNIKADLIIANNVLAHVPDINDFVKGFSCLLKHDGVATFEFPYLLNLINKNQFDTIYHEHYSYLSLISIENVFRENGLKIFDLEDLQTHGGSLRLYAQCSLTGIRPVSSLVERKREEEIRSGVSTRRYYENFQIRINKIKNDFVTFLIKAKQEGKKVVAYGAAAKGNTFLNYAGIRPDLISFVVDRNPAKQGKYMPGSRIPIVEEARLLEEKPDYVVILPWNLRDEIISQLKYLREWGGKYVTAVPYLEVV